MTGSAAKCRGCEAQLCAYIDDALSFDERRAVEEHLLECPACAAFHADAEAAARTLRHAPAVEVPASLVAAVIHDTIGYAGSAPLAACSPQDNRAARFFRPLFGPILQPRFTMSMAAAALSFSMLTFQARNIWQGRQDGEFSAAALAASIESKIEAVSNDAAEFYDAVLTVYRLQTDFMEQSVPEPQQEGADER